MDLVCLINNNKEEANLFTCIKTSKTRTSTYITYNNLDNNVNHI